MKTFNVSDAYNARYLKPEKVAETFVFTDDFAKLLQLSNTVILGPRGSGKTTLLKMLSIEALTAWNPNSGPEQASLKDLDFISVFIPADLVWKDQIESVRNKTDKCRRFRELVTEIIINANILDAFLNSIDGVLKLKLSYPSESISSFCNAIYNLWKLPNDVNSIKALKRIMQNKLFDIGILVDKAYNLNYTEEECFESLKQMEFSDFFFINYTNALTSACGLFEEIFFPNDNKTWFLCFDELELVPTLLFKNLINQLRNSPQKFILKLSMAPVVGTKPDRTSIIPLENHDYTIIRLWPHDLNKQTKISDFTQNLVISKLQKHVNAYYSQRNYKIKEKDLKKIFGQTDYLYALKEFKLEEQPEYDELAEVGEKGSISWFTFRELAKTDPIFSSFLEKDRKISAENPIARNVEQKNEVFRKVKEIVINRLVFTKMRLDEERIFRTRKLFPIYYGTKTIYTICEGNPRWIMRMIESMYPFIREGENGLYILPRDQVSCLNHLAEQFYNLNYSFPERYYVNGTSWHLCSLIEKLGLFVSNKINKGEFSANPVSTFIIDDNLNENFIKLIKLGILTGALIMIEPKKPFLTSDLRGEKIRLNYLLSSIYRIPLRQYHTISLSTVLNSSSSAPRIKRKIDPNQMELDYENNIY
jgi:hypothetical protein